MTPSLPTSRRRLFLDSSSSATATGVSKARQDSYFFLSHYRHRSPTGCFFAFLVGVLVIYVGGNLYFYHVQTNAHHVSIYYYYYYYYYYYTQQLLLCGAGICVLGLMVMMMMMIGTLYFSGVKEGGK